MRRKLLLIGLDGATLDLVRPWAREGKLPNLARIIREGASGTLRSVVPTVSPAAWTTMITGQNPGKHGIYDFVARTPDSYRLRSARRDLSQLRTVFGLLSQAGKRVGVINVPFTYPPEKVNGFMVSGLKAPWRGRWTYPSELQDQLRDQGYWIKLRTAYQRGANEESFIQEMLDTAKMRVETALKLMDEQAWDFFMVVFRGTDDVLLLWHLRDPKHPLHDPELAERYGDGIERVYRTLDDCVGRLLDQAGDDTTTLIASDHGGGAVLKDVYLNNWLHQHGYLAFKRRESSAIGLRRLLRRVGLTRDMGWKLLGPNNLERVKRLCPFLARWAPEATVTLDEAVDWDATQAYSFGYIGQIYVNLKGREPQGTVAPGANYQQLIQHIEQDLRTWRDPEDGEAVVDAVLHKDDLYHGPYVAQAPDLCLIMRGMSYITNRGQELTSQSNLGPPLHTGSHRLDGMLMAVGAHIQAGSRLGDTALADIAPTVLYLLDVPIPSDTDGRVLREILSPSLIRSRPIKRDEGSKTRPSEFLTDGWSDEDEKELIEHLKDLGYLS